MEKKMIRIAVKRVGKPLQVLESELKAWDAMKKELGNITVERYPIGKGVLVHLDENGAWGGTLNFHVQTRPNFFGDVVFMKSRGAGYSSLTDGDLELIAGILAGTRKSEY